MVQSGYEKNKKMFKIRCLNNFDSIHKIMSKISYSKVSDRSDG